MSERKRINISVDPETYTQLNKLKDEYGFKNLCELVVAFSHILIDRVKPAAKRKYDLPDDDRRYIDSMFDDLAEAEKEKTTQTQLRYNRNNRR